MVVIAYKFNNPDLVVAACGALFVSSRGDIPSLPFDCEGALRPLSRDGTVLANRSLDRPAV